jgi:cytosine/adenosine deaminase-related metal-dependent hydrolase
MKISRKGFLKGLGLVSAAGMVTGINKVSGKTMQTMDTILYKNVKLETGFIITDDYITATKTELFTLEISNGKIKALLPNQPQNSTAIDAKGLLMLPPFRDMHIHLDKTFYGLKWQAKLPQNRSVKDNIAYEQKILPDLLKTSTERAELLIELLQSKGSNYARSHVNIEPTSGLNSLKNLQKAIGHKKDGFGAELVAFPQHGVFYTDTAPILKDAAQMDIDFIGGLDPYSIDGSIEKQMDYIIQLALDYNKGIDIHLHESGESGMKTIEYLINKVNENPVLKGKSYVSHAFALAAINSKEAEATAEKLAAAGVGIASTVPIGDRLMPIPTLLKHGVKVVVGNDSIVDHWGVFGTGSVLEKANIAAQLYRMRTEFELSRALSLASGGILPLDDAGKQQWPKANDPASFVLVDAASSAEAVARVPEIKSLVNNGLKVF